MIKLLFILITGSALALLLSFVGSMNGNVIIYWLGYRVDMSILATFTVLILFLAVFTFLIVLIYKLFSFGSYRNAIKCKKEVNSCKEGMSFVADGFIALIAGDLKKAEQKYSKAMKEIKNHTLVNLLNAQIELYKRNYNEAANLFRNSKKCKDDELEFIANEMYLNEAKKDNDTSEIIRYAEEILNTKPKNENAIKSLISTYFSVNQTKRLEDTLIYAEKNKVYFSKDEKSNLGVQYTSIAQYYLSEGDYRKVLEYAKKARKIANDSLPIDLIESRALINLGKIHYAALVIKNAWKKHPHPELLKLYLMIYSKFSEAKRLKKVKELYKINRDSFESYIAMARILLEADKLAEAKEFARSALDIRKTQNVYRLLWEIEKRQNPDARILDELYHNAQTAKKDYSWVCSECGAVYSDWMSNCKKCGSVNTIKWTSVKC